jgi:hypothetical protein
MSDASTGVAQAALAYRRVRRGAWPSSSVQADDTETRSSVAELHHGYKVDFNDMVYNNHSILLDYQEPRRPSQAAWPSDNTYRLNHILTINLMAPILPNGFVSQRNYHDMQENGSYDASGLRFHADEHTIEREENNKMNEETQAGKDYFWIYVALATAALVGVVVMAKLSENDKYDPIRAQQNEEVARMNIRVLN